MTSYLPPSSPESVRRLAGEDDMTPGNEPGWGRRDEKEKFIMGTNVQRLGGHVTAALLGRLTP